VDKIVQNMKEKKDIMTACRLIVDIWLRLATPKFPFGELRMSAECIHNRLWDNRDKDIKETWKNHVKTR